MAYDPLDPNTDCFRPPAIPTLVGCLHCQQEYESFLIEWRVEKCADGKDHGFWCCPTPDCGGRGFGFDIFPVDPNYRDENGNLMWCSDEGEDELTEEELAELDGTDPDVPPGERPPDEDLPF
jgi:hypothetical protein